LSQIKLLIAPMAHYLYMVGEKIEQSAIQL